MREPRSSKKPANTTRKTVRMPPQSSGLYQHAPDDKRKTWTSEKEYLAAQKGYFDQMSKQPPETCTLCGYPMDYNGHKLSDWEKKWSTHEVCRDKVHGMLDRESGVARERRANERRR